VRVVNTTYKQDMYYSVDFHMYPGAFFGEESFLLNCPRSSRTFLAMKDVTVCVVDRALFESVEIFQPAIDQLVIEVATRLQVVKRYPK
jgi:CRP-like cAMP-binding protein